MKKRFFLPLLCSVLLLSACGTQAPGQSASLTPSPSPPEQAASTAVTFTDDLGRSVTVNRPQRVACLTASFADVWCLAGGAEQIVAATSSTWFYFDLPLKDDVVDLGGSKELSMEQLLACQPDFILGSCGTDRNTALEDSLDEMGIPTAYFSVNSFQDYLRMLKACTDITGHTENYQAYGVAVGERLEQALARPDGSKPTVLYIRATGKSCKVKNSEGSVLGEMLAELDCRNIADSDAGLLEQLSMEAIVQHDPDHIFVVTQGSDPTDAQAVLESTLLNDPAWATLTAVREGRYHVMDQNLYNLKPNARWGEAYEQLANLLYPAG